MRENGVILENDTDATFFGRQVSDFGPGHGDGAFGRRDETGDHAQCRRFAATARSEERKELALLDSEIDMIGGDHVAEPFAQVPKLNVGHLYVSP